MVANAGIVSVGKLWPSEEFEEDRISRDWPFFSDVSCSRNHRILKGLAMKTTRLNPPFTNTFLSRRDFLRRTGAVGLAAVGLSLWLNPWSRSVMAAVMVEEIGGTVVQPPQPLPSVGSSQASLFQSPLAYGFSLGGVQPVEVFGFEGGEAVGRASKGTSGNDGRIPKRIEGMQYRDIVFYYLPVPGSPINAWLTNSLKGTAQTVHGSIIVKERLSGDGSDVQFSGGFLRQIVFPEVDIGLGQQPAPLRITLGIQQAEYNSATMSPHKFIQIPFITSAPMKGFFDLSFQNTGNIQNVVQVESPTFTARLLPVTKGSGFQRAIPIDYSNLKFQLPEKQAGPFYAWHSDFMLKGKNDDKFETKGTLRWLSRKLTPTDKVKPVLTLEFEHLGILSVVRLPTNPGYVQVEMYCEQVVPTSL